MNTTLQNKDGKTIAHVSNERRKIYPKQSRAYICQYVSMILIFLSIIALFKLT